MSWRISSIKWNLRKLDLWYTLVKHHLCVVFSKRMEKREYPKNRWFFCHCNLIKVNIESKVLVFPIVQTVNNFIKILKKYIFHSPRNRTFMWELIHASLMLFMFWLYRKIHFFPRVNRNPYFCFSREDQIWKNSENSNVEKIQRHVLCIFQSIVTRRVNSK